jgi:excisionase family DNA binding protein
MRAGIEKPVSLDELPEFCSLEEFSEVFRVSRATAYRMAAQGKIPSLRIGRRVIVSKKHLMSWLGQSISCENDEPNGMKSSR